MPERNVAAGMAALTITETTLLLMIEKGLLKSEDIGDALEDVAQIHRDTARSTACSTTAAAHAAAKADREDFPGVKPARRGPETA